MPLQIKRGPTADRSTYTPVQGELVFDTDENKLYVGDGATVGGVATTSISLEDAEQEAASLFTTGIHTGISFTYNNLAGRIDAQVAEFLESDIKGSVFADNSTLLVDGVSATFNLDGTVKGNIIPNADSAYDLGSASFKFRDLYLSGTSIHLGSAVITSTGTAVDLPAGSTVNGNIIGASGSGVVEGSTYKINIAADDSSIMLDTDLETVTASGGFFGNLTGYHTGDTKGSVFADDSSILVDAVSGVILGDVASQEIKLGTATAYNSRFHSTIPGEITTDVTGSIVYRVNAQTVALGSESYSSRLNVYGDGAVGTVGNFYTAISGGGALSKRLVFYRANGSNAAPTAIADSERIIDIDFNGYDGTDYVTSATIRAIVDGSVTTGRVPGSLIFLTADSTGTLQTGIRIDSTNGVTLQGNLTADSGSVLFYGYSNAQTAKSLNLYRARGSRTSFSVAQANDHIYSLKWNAYDGSAYQQVTQIRGEIDGSLLGGGIIPGKLRMMTVDSTGVMATAIVIDSLQNVQIPKRLTIQSGGVLTLSVYADSTARGTAIPAPTAGMVCITGTSFTFYDGSAWQTLT
jgi:hypothetical protein